jgi:hypothetical protein
LKLGDFASATAGPEIGGKTLFERGHRMAATLFSLNVLTVQPLIALIFGILILLIPRLLNLLVAIYLIIIGVAGLWPQVFH